MKCVNCGNEIPEGVSFCTACGQPINTQNTTAQENASNNASNYTSSYASNNGGNVNNTGYANPNYNNYVQPNNDGMDYKPISMWGYFGYELLFSIPCVGLILLLVFSFGGTKNINLRNFARSYFCFLIVVVIIFVVVLAVGGGIAGMLALGGYKYF